MPEDRPTTNVEQAVNLTVAWLNNPNVRANTDDATSFLKNVHDTLNSLSAGDGNYGSNASSEQAAPAAAESNFEPKVSVRKSLGSRTHIISMIDGKPYQALRRHLSSHGLTPAQYRERYGLNPDYPMVAPAYTEKRREIARNIGLGSKGRGRKAAAPKTVAAKPAMPKPAAPKPATGKAPAKRRGRPPKS